MFFSFFFIFFFLFFKNFSKPTFSARSVNIGENFFLNGKRIIIYNKTLNTQVFDEDLENSFFLLSNPQILNLNEYEKIDTTSFFKTISDEISKLEINAYLNMHNKKYYLIDFKSINEENFPILSNYLINDNSGKKIGFEISYLIPLLIDFTRKSKGGIIVVENTSKIENDQIDMNGKLNINSENNLNGDLTVEIQSGSDDIKIGDNSTGNIFLGNLYGNSEINGSEIFINSIENLKIGISENKKIDPDGINYYYFMLDDDGNIYKSINPILKNTTQEGLVVDGNETTIKNTNLGLYGLIRINNDDFSKTDLGVDIRAGNKKISIGNSDTGDSVEETGNVIIGNTNGFTHLYGGIDFTIRTTNSGTGVLALGDKNDNSKISIESGTNEINIGKDSTGNINVGNSINTTGIVNLNGQININANGPTNGICFNLLLNGINFMKGYVSGDLTIGNDAKKLHLYGSEIWLIGRNNGNIFIGKGSQSDNPKVQIESGTNEINIGINSTGNINLGNSTGILSLNGQINIKSNGPVNPTDGTCFNLLLNGVNLMKGYVSGDLTIGNDAKKLHLYGSEIFLIGNGGDFRIGDSTKNSKIVLESGTNEINIGTDSTGNINIGNLTGNIDLKAKSINFLIEDKTLELKKSHGTFYLDPGSNHLSIGNYSKGPLILGCGLLSPDSLNSYTHIYGRLIRISSETILEIGNKHGSYKEGASIVNIGTDTPTEINIGNSSGILSLGSSAGSSIKIILKSTNSVAPNGTTYYMLMVDSNGNVFKSNSAVLANTVSSKKYKENIKRAEIDSEKFKKLLPVIFDYKKEMNSGKKNQWGLIAEDVFDLGLTEAVEFDENGEIYGLNYRTIFMMLLKSYLDSLEKLENFEDRINELEKENLSLKNKK